MGTNGQNRSCSGIGCINPYLVHVLGDIIMAFNNENVVETIACDCVHDFQDKRYGKGRRAFTKGTTDGKEVKRCTVCGRDK